MKRKLLLCVAVCASISVFPQNSKMKPSPSGKENLKPLLKSEVNENPVSPVNTVTKNKVSTVNPAPQNNSASKTSAVNTWSNISTSMNIYGVLISYCKPLQYNDELNAVSFIHRKPGTAINGTNRCTGNRIIYC